MKIHRTLLTLACALCGCGGDSSPTFEGVWSGSFTSFTNNCPFSVASDINPLFPMTVSVDADNVFTVVAVDGSTAVGGQGTGETISFLAQSSAFGKYGSIAPYTCASTVTTVGFLDAGDDKARVTLTITFTNCVTTGSTSKAVTCGATYYGDAEKTG